MKLSVELAVLILGFGSCVFAQTAKHCTSSNICYSLNIPDSTASSGQGDIFFQITAPTTYEWVALGQGSRMSGSNMFVVYTDGTGTNVTLSPRLGVGHNEPKYDTSAAVWLLDGSGVSDGVMTANVKCSSCHSWSGGNMDFTASSLPWIWAATTGDQLKSDSTSADISMHDAMGDFEFATSAAKGGDSANPFVVALTSSNSSRTASGTSVVAASTSSSGSSGATSNQITSDTSSVKTPFGGDRPKAHMLILIHGVLASLAFVIFFPVGSILIRLANFPGSIWIHAAIQALGYVLFIVAAGIGIYFALQIKQLNAAHPIIGLVLFALLAFQPILGLLHHRFFKRYSKRTVWSHAHLWLGRIAITVGIINGGIGLQMAGQASRAQIIAYAVVGAFMWLVYVASAVFGEVKKKRTTSVRKSSEEGSPELLSGYKTG